MVMGLKAFNLALGLSASPVEAAASGGLCIFVDPADAEMIAGYPWRISHFGKTRRAYAVAHTKSGPLLMHRLIIGAKPGQMVDHINGNGLDNRRQNLRFCDRSQNQWNSTRHKKGESGYKGVWRDDGRWRAVLKFHGRRVHIGIFETALEAAHAYDKKAKELFGEFARGNF